ncbi:MAG: hypothetical protein A2W99_06595 [Bacteroidetes bacterium GWF2_33_16]|nr:MAG: hypothetical protein A2X00_05865 [Bacteroidetes bacterium GWE2_32_14]OFY05009.1 MAG: hypothetical protein A2W99_06595 [Bacteroidetes bacterium GWF2_33_16]
MREVTKQKIMDVALELFAYEGYFQTSISTIAKKAGISKGLMYNYFESKESLLRDIAIEGLNEIIESFDPNKDGILTKEEFIYFIRKSAELVKEQLTFWKLYFSLMAQPQVLMVLGDGFMSSFDSYFKSLAKYFHNQGIEDGYSEVRFFVAMLDGITLHYIIDPENFPFDKAIEKIISIYE